MVRLTRIYTKTGDAGRTRLVGGIEVAKDARRVEAYGTVDELNAAVGVARMEIARHSAGGTGGPRKRSAAKPALAKLDVSLARIQQELFNLGSDLATAPAPESAASPAPVQVPVIEERHVTALEQDIDAVNDHLPPLESFVLPGGGAVGAALHVARTVCRRAEREVVRLGREERIGAQVLPYLNRLSDALFVFSREAARVTGEAEPLWEPRKT